MYPERRPNADQSPESLAARLRALPPPSVPADLETRLLAAMPVARPVPRRHWPLWAGAACALAAVCLLAVLAWPRRESKNPAPNPVKRDLVRQVMPQPPNDSIRFTERLDEAKMPTFTWPLEETSPMTVSTWIPPDLLD